MAALFIKLIVLLPMFTLNLFVNCYRPSMSQGTVLHARQLDKDYIVGTPEEFVRRFKGTRVINKVMISLVRKKL